MDVRAQLSNTLFYPGSDRGAYISHVKIWEDIPGSDDKKPRYILLCVQPDGDVKIHKSKRNTNNSFSIGKTWAIKELQALDVLQPLAFRITIGGRPFTWHTERSREQTDFLVCTVRSYRQYTKGRSPKLTGFGVQEIPNSPPAYIVPNANSRGGVPPPDARQPTNSFSNISSNTPSSSRPPPRDPSDSPLSATAPTSRRYNNTNNSTLKTDSPTTPSRPQTAQSGSSYATSDAFSAQLPPQQQSQRPGAASLPSPLSASSSMRELQSQPTASSSTSSIPQLSTLEQERERDRLARRKEQEDFLAAETELTNAQERLLDSKTRITASESVPELKQRRKNSDEPRHISPRRPSVDPSTSPASSSSLSKRRPSEENSKRSNSVESREPSNNNNNNDSNNNLPKNNSRVPPPRPKLSLNNVSTPSSSSTNLNLPASATRPNLQTRPSISSAMAVTTPINDTNPSLPFLGLRDVDDTTTALDNVEEMLDGLEWRTFAPLGGASADDFDGTGAGSSSSTAVEQRLIEELRALEQASIHATAESDDQAQMVVKHLDSALAELDRMDQMLSLYKSHLYVVTDDIKHIESQSKGLQVETTNQRALLRELEGLLDTVHIPKSDVDQLIQSSFEPASRIQDLEKAAVNLYKAILSTRNTAGGLAAASENASEYRRHSKVFAKRFHEFLDGFIKKQIDKISSALKARAGDKSLILPKHTELEENLGKYVGLVLFVKEIEDSHYQQICASYFTNITTLYKREFVELFSQVKATTRKPTEDEVEASMAHSVAVTLGRSVSHRRGPSTAGRASSTSSNLGCQNLRKALEFIVPHVHREQEFVADFLNLHSLERYITFADYMDLETVFKRGTQRYLSDYQGRFKDVRSAMELIFGFLGTEVATLLDSFIQTDPTQVVGALAALDACINRAESIGVDIVVRMVQKQYQRIMAQFTKQAKERLQVIEQTELTVKKRKGVVAFMRVFPQYVETTEKQLDGASRLRIRKTVDDLYGSMIKTMFESLQQMAKMDQDAVENEDKDQLNYHVVLIENMHHFVATLSPRKYPSLKPFVQQAKDIYEENMSLYVRFVVRRPLARLIDFFKGLGQLLQSTPANEVGLHSEFKRSAFKRVLSTMDSKDLKRAIESLGKRVDKHFNDVSNPSAENRALVNTVWSACERDFMVQTNKWSHMVKQCYADLNMEYSSDDVKTYFARFSPVPTGSLGNSTGTNNPGALSPPSLHRSHSTA